MAAAYCNGDLLQLFGPPYSSPTLFTSCFLQQPQRSPARRMPQTGVWQIDLLRRSAVLGTVTDFAVSGVDCIVRHIECSEPVCLRLSPSSEDGKDFDYECVEQAEETQVLFKTRNGNSIYNDYPLPFPQFFGLVVRGDAILDHTSPYTYDIRVDGIADLLMVGGPSYPECMENLKSAEKLSYAELLAQTAEWWKNALEPLSRSVKCPDGFPYTAELRAAAEDTAVCILVQQAAEGGVLAGYVYHLGYVRDQYGVCMTMLRLGLYEQARRMLCFYIDVFRHSGFIRNAQALGIPNLFHYAENDDTEITGYLLLQFFRYAEAVRDDSLLLENADFLNWLYERQVSQLWHDMLPFNGDETYIAGGLLPRDVINDGSAEATMLFLLSGNELLLFLKKHHLAKLGELVRMRSALEKTQDAYTRNFVRNGHYTLNAPERLEGLALPQYRYGVCMNLGQGECAFFGWTKLCRGGVYLCPRCQNRKALPVRKDRPYQLPSALLMPAYLGADLLKEETVTAYLHQLSMQMEKEGQVFSNPAEKKNVGYDYGLMLLNFARYQIPNAQAVFEKLLELRDEAGVWSEYYINDEPNGTRYRPWESAINLDAMLQYAENWTPETGREPETEEESE